MHVLLGTTVVSEDPESDATQIEMEFLHRKETCAEPEHSTWTWPNAPDIDIIDADWCFTGPSVPISSNNNAHGSSYLKFEEEPDAMKKFTILKKCKD